MDLGELFVRVRPNVSSFQAEAEGPIAKAGKDLSKVFLAAFAVGGIAESIKGVVEAATEHQSAFAVLSTTLKNAGASNVLYGQSIEALLEKEARLKGFSDEELAAGFQRLVAVTHNSRQAFDDLGKAEDLARFRHIDLAAAALAVSKAEQGSVTALQRYGIVVPHATEATEKLKAAHDAAVAAGATFTAGQKLEYAQALKNAAAVDVQGKKTEALALIQERAGGSAAKFASTASGQFARAQQDFHQFEVTIGEDLLPSLSSGAEALGSFFTKLADSRDVQEQAAKAAHDISTGFHDIAQVLETIGPPLASVTDDLGGFVRVGELAAGLLVGNKILGALAGIGAEEAVVATGSAAAAASIEALTLAVNANTFALAGNADALAVVASREALVGAGAGAAAGKVGILSGSLSILKRALIEYIVVNQAVKALPGQHDLGLDFSNSAARDAAGSNDSPYPKGSTLDLLYQAGKGGQKGPVLSLGGGTTEKLKQLGKAEAQAYQAGIASGVNQYAAGGVPRVASDPNWRNLVKVGAKSARDEATHNRDLIKAGNEAIKSLREGIVTDQTDLAQLKKDMADAVTQGAQAVDQAVQSAKQNLTSIGQSLAASIGTFIDKPLNDEAQRLSDTQDRITARFDKLTAALQAGQQKLSREQAQIGAAADRKNLKQLGDSVLLPGGKKLDADPQKALAQLEALQKITRSPALDDFVLRYRSASLQVQQDTLGLRASAIDARKQAADTGLQLSGDSLKLRQDAAAHAKQQALTQIANLTDELASGRINEPAFDKALSRILKRNHLTFIAAAKADGIAFADTFAAQLAGLGLQETALKAGPQRPGSGLEPSIVRPLDTLNQTQKTIAGIASQERAKQLDESKKQTALLKKIDGNAKAQSFINSLEKNPGTAAKRLKALAGVTG